MDIPALRMLSDADLADLEAAFAEDAHDPDLDARDAAHRALAAVRTEQDRRR